jgi:serine/threonine protein phosphatase PrpC
VSLELRFAARSDVGLLRTGNEDAAYAGPRLLAVADGMGGHAAGEVASAVAIGALVALDEDLPGNDLIAILREAVEDANQRLREMVTADPALEGMGTTLTALLWAGRRLGLAHVGDSRCYLLRDGVLAQITHDHTLVQTLVDEGRLSPEEASSHPQRSLITRALDGRGEVELDLSIRESRVGDRYLLCTDGLSGVVSEQTMLEALHEPDPVRSCEQLVELALRGGGPDNVTCIVADVTEVSSEGAEGPVPALVGAAGTAPEGAGPTADSSAKRAALATGAQRSGRRRLATRGGPARHRTAWIAAPLALLVLAGLIIAGYFLDRAQWYLGSTAGKPRMLALYEGFDTSVLGLHFSDVAERSRIPVGALDIFDQQQLGSGIPVANRRAGQRRLDALGAEACVTLAALLPTPPPTPTPTPTPTPSTSRTPHPTATPTRTVTSPKPKAQPSRTASPSPTALPATALAALRTLRDIGCPIPVGNP